MIIWILVSILSIIFAIWMMGAWALFATIQTFKPAYFTIASLTKTGNRYTLWKAIALSLSWPYIIFKLFK